MMHRLLMLLLVFTPLAASAAFNADVRYGSKGADVLQPQKFSNTQSVSTRPAIGNFLFPTEDTSLFTQIAAILRRQIGFPQGSPLALALTIALPPGSLQPGMPSVRIFVNGKRFSVRAKSGSAVVLSWSSANAKMCTITPGGFTGVSGSTSSGALTADQTYTATCTGANDKTATSSVTVVVAQPSPSVTLTANPASVAKGQASRLSWSSQNTRSCIASYKYKKTPRSSWSGTKNLSGSETVIPLQTSTYVITCAGVNGGEAQASMTIEVRPRQLRTVRVLELQYYPVKADGVNLDDQETGFSMTLAAARASVAATRSGFITSIQQATTYLRDASATPSLRPVIRDSFEFLTPLPRSQERPQWPDYKAILNGRNICGLVDTQGVREVWIWRYHDVGTVYLAESNMAMGTRSRQYWNHGTYGDVSNSDQSDDLPVCEHSYTVYEFNYSRGLGEALENYGHQLQVIFDIADPDLFWGRWAGIRGDAARVNNCGTVHIPPNTAEDYDWRNTREVKSNCSDWHPDGSGAVETVSCTTWGCQDDTGAKFKIWWMQRMPGNNNALSWNGKKLRNWWELVGDFDEGLQKGFTLYEP